MTEEESKNALFKLNKEYMSHNKKERIKLYDEYIRNRSLIRAALIETINEKKQMKL